MAERQIHETEGSAKRPGYQKWGRKENSRWDDQDGHRGLRVHIPYNGQSHSFRTWLARIDGYDIKFGLSRQFLQACDTEDSERLWYEIAEVALFEAQWLESDQVVRRGIFFADGQSFQETEWTVIEKQYGRKPVRINPFGETIYRDRVSDQLYSLRVLSRAGIGEVYRTADNTEFEIIGITSHVLNPRSNSPIVSHCLGYPVVPRDGLSYTIPSLIDEAVPIQGHVAAVTSGAVPDDSVSVSGDSDEAFCSGMAADCGNVCPGDGIRRSPA